MVPPKSRAGLFLLISVAVTGMFHNTQNISSVMPLAGWLSVPFTISVKLAVSLGTFVH
jgi:hypothetical protein